MEQPPSPPPMLEARELSARAIGQYVGQALRGEGTLHEIMDRAIFGPEYVDKETLWCQWPEHAIDAWDDAVRRYAKRAGFTGVQKATPVEVSLDEAWDAVEAAVPWSSEWPDLPDVKNSMIPRPAGVSEVAFMYALIQGQGWSFAGHHSTRRVEAAPCIRCERVVPAPEIVDRLCLRCQCA